MSVESIGPSFWDTTVDYDVLSPLTPEMVSHAQTTLGVQLPDAYLALLQFQNGGQTADPFRAHPAPEPTSWAVDHVPFGSMLGIGERDEGILRNASFLEEWCMPEGLVLLSGDGHCWIALDYRRSEPVGSPSVVWYDNEVGEDIQLAADFQAFVGGLCSEERFDIYPRQ